jgi:hypothetical protein
VALKMTGAFFLLAATCLFAQQMITTTKNVSVAANVQRTASPGVLIFDYKVTNQQTAAGSVWLFAIDVSQPPNTQQLDVRGLPAANRFLHSLSQSLQSSSSAVPAVPLTADAPSGWIGSLSVDGMVMWTGHTALISPGQTVTGYRLYSKGVPTVRQFRAQPYIDVATLDVVPPSSDAADYGVTRRTFNL